MEEDGIRYAWSTKALMIMAMIKATTRASAQSLAALFCLFLFNIYSFSCRAEGRMSSSSALIFIA
ncbi:MAG: hypothetical protein BWZ01_03055 [Deltaproteobacteria bacterium ADurb.BinA179]|nr:MAG: hypothetical protein BWZ01_03055 [Deltaproteobacteria bacterium ADurb.BinA179]